MNIYTIAKKLMQRHGLHDWSFQLFDAQTICSDSVIGSCNYTNKIISLSLKYARMMNFVSIRSIILHEIAHALVGEGHGHDEVWVQCAKEIGSEHLTHCLEEITQRDLILYKERDCVRPELPEFINHFSNIDDMCHTLAKVYGGTQKYWYDEYKYFLLTTTSSTV